MVRNVVVWFRNDLRLRDNAVLHLARVGHADRLLGVYCQDARFENERTRKFRQEALADLERGFASAFGAPLLVFEGKPEKVLPDLVARIEGEGAVVCSQEVTSYETRVDSKVRKALEPLGWGLEMAWNYSMYHPDDIELDVLGGGLPEPFTAFRKTVESRGVRIRSPLEVPQLDVQPVEAKAGMAPLTEGALAGVSQWADTDHKSFSEAHPQAPAAPAAAVTGGEDKENAKQTRGLQFRGGESAAYLRLEHFVKHGLATYKNTRNRSTGWDYSTKLSPWLAAGCISPRQIHHRIRDYEDQHGESVHTYWVTFELLWRDYLRFFAAKHGNKIFFEAGPAEAIPNGVQWDGSDRTTLKRLEAWKAGLTGVPWVDGHMRELKSTGFMSNRGRQNVASFLIHNLHVDWRHGARHFEETLIDHDVSANWCNWVIAAGVGARGQRVNRFNMDKQARDYDKLAEHARLWVPELRDTPPASVHNLALRPVGQRGAGGLLAGNATLDKWLAQNKLEKPAGSGGGSDSGSDSGGGLGAYPGPIVKVSPSKIDPSKLKHNKREHRGRKRTFYTH